MKLQFGLLFLSLTEGRDRPFVDIQIHFSADVVILLESNVANFI